MKSSPICKHLWLRQSTFNLPTILRSTFDFCCCESKKIINCNSVKFYYSLFSSFIVNKIWTIFLWCSSLHFSSCLFFFVLLKCCSIQIETNFECNIKLLCHFQDIFLLFPPYNHKFYYLQKKKAFWELQK